jgi:hypothetical protein
MPLAPFAYCRPWQPRPGVFKFFIEIAPKPHANTQAAQLLHQPISM